jgi:hypothetical protein
MGQISNGAEVSMILRLPHGRYFLPAPRYRPRTRGLTDSAWSDPRWRGWLRRCSVSERQRQNQRGEHPGRIASRLSACDMNGRDFCALQPGRRNMQRRCSVLLPRAFCLRRPRIVRRSGLAFSQSGPHANIVGPGFIEAAKTSDRGFLTGKARI